MNIFDRVIRAGIPVPEAFYENYVCVALSEVARKAGMSKAEARADLERQNAAGTTYLTVFHRLSDGEEIVSGYIFQL